MSLLLYLKSHLGAIETQLGWTDSSYDSVIADTLLCYGVDLESDATDTNKLYKLGIYFLWKKIYRELLFSVDFSADGVSLKNSQLVDNAKSQLNLATNDAINYLPNNRVTFYRSHPQHHFDEFSGDGRRW